MHNFFMISIQHNRLNVQVGSGFHSPIHRNPENDDEPTTIGLSRLQRTAFELHDLGLNVFPQPIGKKGGLPWKALQFNRLERDDQRYGLTTLFAGSANLAVMCGRTSGNLFVIDCETPEALRHHMRKLRQRRIPLWVVQTARGGHIYLRASDGEIHNIASGTLADTEIKGQQGYVLAPPSIHPSGAVYEWLHQEGQRIPTVHSTQIDWLRDESGHPVHLQVTKQHSSTPGQWKKPRQRQTVLSRKTQDYLQQGHNLPEGTRNNRLFAAACDLAGNGYGHDAAVRQLLPIAVNNGLSEHEIRASIASAYSQPRTPSRPPTQEPEEDQSWWAMLLWTTNHEWRGRTASTDRVLMLALIERARVSKNENRVFRASIRELAELARMGTTTVRKGLRRLQAEEIIFSCGKDHSSGASLWKFNQQFVREGELQIDTLALSPHWLRYSESVFNSELAECGLVGRSVLYIFTFLLLYGGYWMPSALAEAIGVTVNQVNYSLRKLSQLNLIRREKRGWYLIIADLREAEDVLVTDDSDEPTRKQRRRRRFQRERARFAGRLLYDARLRQEGKAYYEAIYAQNQPHDDLADLLNDPLIALGLELGGVLRLSDGRSVAMQSQ